MNDMKNHNFIDTNPNQSIYHYNQNHCQMVLTKTMQTTHLRQKAITAAKMNFSFKEDVTTYRVKSETQN